MLKKISIDQARAGMHVHEICGSWFDNPFWSSSFFLHDVVDVHKLQASGVRELWIDTEKERDIELRHLDPNAQQVYTEEADLQDEVHHPVPRFVFERQTPSTMQDEIARATKILSKSREAVSVMFNDARMGQMSSVKSALTIVDEIASSILRHSGTLLTLVRLKNTDDYTYMHSVAVCAMMIALAKQLKFADEQVRECGLAGLLHDIGKMTIPPAILNKCDRLTDDEFTTVKRHPTAGYEMLKDVDGMSNVVLDVCLHHHERIDGAGYPDKLAGDSVSQAARMGAICDVYDAITSNRPYKEGWSPTDSLSKMAVWAKDGHFDEIMFAAFVKCIGIYPVGTLVRLKSGRLAVVVDNSKSLVHPTVRAFFSIKSMVYISPTTLELSRPGTTDAISNCEDARKWNIKNLDSYWNAL